MGDKYFFTLSSSQGLYQFQYDFQVSNAYIFRPLEVVNPGGTRVRSVVDYAFAHFVSAGVGLMDFWQLGVTLPVVSQASFLDPSAAGGAAPSNVFRIGDLRISSKLRLLDSNKSRWGVAIEPAMTIPLGGDQKYLGESSITGGLNIIGEFLITPRIRAAINTGFQALAERVVINNIDFQYRFLSALGLSANLGRQIVASIEGHGSTGVNKFFSSRESVNLEFTGGVKWKIKESGFSVGLGGGTCIVCGVRGAKARGFLDVGYRRMNESYALLSKKEEKMRIVTLGGKILLEPYEVYELVEKCPIESKDFQMDRDDPQCTEIYELAQVAEECPDQESYDPKEDNPKCMQVYALREYDTDKDLVPDTVDLCPTESGLVHEKGCPEKGFLIIAPEKGEIITRTIPFEFNKATLSPDAIPILDTLAGAIHSQPDIKLLSIEGHTDDVGGQEANLILSVERAKTVYNYLIDHGINPERLTYKGYGKKYPLSDNDNEEGRAVNRRVEFKIKKVSS